MPWLMNWKHIHNRKQLQDLLFELGKDGITERDLLIEFKKRGGSLDIGGDPRDLLAGWREARMVSKIGGYYYVGRRRPTY